MYLELPLFFTHRGAGVKPLARTGKGKCLSWAHLILAVLRLTFVDFHSIPVWGGLGPFPHQNPHTRDFPGSPVIKTLQFLCRGHGFGPWLGN